MEEKNTSKLIIDWGTNGPSIVSAEENYWDLHNRSKVQSSMEISLW